MTNPNPQDKPEAQRRWLDLLVRRITRVAGITFMAAWGILIVRVKFFWTDAQTADTVVCGILLLCLSWLALRGTWLLVSDLAGD